jgi:FkbM family methyltransferase
MIKIKHLFDLNSLINKYRYNLHASSVSKPYFDRDLIIKEGYQSQCGQDKWVVETILPDLDGGIFIDIGAHDGISFSNTYFLEKELGWTGIAVEPIPEIFERLKNNRKCQLINGCISEIPGKAKFYKISGYAEMLSGLYDRYDTKHLERIQREISQYGGSYEIQEVDSYTLNQILEEHKMFHIDYLNIDVEGAELSILKSINFDIFDISVIGCENNYKDFRIPQLLKKNGYTLHSIVGDEFYIKSKIL